MSMFNIAAIKDAADLAGIARAAGIELKKRNGEWQACCPFHGEKTPSFTIYEKGNSQLFKCFGCGEQGDVITFVEKVYKTDTRGALLFLSGKTDAGIMPVKKGFQGQSNIKKEDAEKRRAAHKRASAHEIFKGGLKWHPTVAAYLKARCIDVEKIGGIPSSLRFNPEVLYAETGELLPAMVAPIVNIKKQLLAVHRTYLKADGSGKADVEKQKMVLGGFSGGFIPLYDLDDHLNIAEGIETALSVRAYGITGGFWTSVSLDNMCNLVIPPQVRSVTIWADNDMKEPEPGKRDPRETIRKAARLIRDQRPGRLVNIKWPPLGRDFNDCLKEGVQI
jgi:DNA primase